MTINRKWLSWTPWSELTDSSHRVDPCHDYRTKHILHTDTRRPICAPATRSVNNELNDQSTSAKTFFRHCYSSCVCVCGHPFIYQHFCFILQFLIRLLMGKHRRTVRCWSICWIGSNIFSTIEAMQTQQMDG